MESIRDPSAIASSQIHVLLMPVEDWKGKMPAQPVRSSGSPMLRARNLSLSPIASGIVPG